MHRDVTFTVTNRADPAGPEIPDNIVSRVLCQNPLDPEPDSTSGDGLELWHCFMAARLLGAQFGLRQEGSRVTFWATIRVPEILAPESMHRQGTYGAQLPPASLFTDLKIYAIDDSSSIRKWLRHALSSMGTVDAFGASGDDVRDFLDAVLSDGDIAICDQNLEFQTGTVYGTELLKQLKECGFPGLMCIHSSNDSPEDLETYAAAGAHLSLSKGMAVRDLVKSLRQAYGQYIAAGPCRADGTWSRGTASHVTRSPSMSPTSAPHGIASTSGLMTSLQLTGPSESTTTKYPFPSSSASHATNTASHSHSRSRIISSQSDMKASSTMSITGSFDRSAGPRRSGSLIGWPDPCPRASTAQLLGDEPRTSEIPGTCLDAVMHL